MATIKSISETNVEYHATFWSSTAILLQRIISLLGGIYIAKILYDNCLFCPISQTNPIVVTFFAVIGLACFDSVGIPISKIAPNIKIGMS